MKYFSMFSGIGGFEKGISQATEDKAECIGFSEIDKYAISIYEKHFGGHKNYGDAREIVSEGLPGFDLLVGGFPCQSFSIAGKRGGFEDTRGTLSLRYAELRKQGELRFCSLRTLKDYLITKRGRLSRKSSRRWMNWGMTVNGKCLTARASECHSTGKGYSLSDILEENPDPKYFLSEKATKKILWQLKLKEN